MKEHGNAAKCGAYRPCLLTSLFVRRSSMAFSMKEHGNTAQCGAYQPCLLSSLFVRGRGMAFNMKKVKLMVWTSAAAYIILNITMTIFDYLTTIINKAIWRQSAVCSRKRHFYAIILAAILLISGGCGVMTSNAANKPDGVLGDISYDKTKSGDCIIYIKENDSYEPYYVVSSNYGGNALLLRKNLLSETMPYNANEKHLWSGNEYGGYYEDSGVDKYLNADFYDSLERHVKNAIVCSDIIIADKKSLGVTGDLSTTISRKVFLLSLSELSAAKSYAAVPEGDPLKFFSDDYKRRAAYLPDGEECAYWTRTPETWEIYTVFTVGKNGIGSGAADIDSGVRPAFCLDKSTPVSRRPCVVENQKAYVVSNDN